MPHRRNHSERGPAQRPEPAIVVHRGCVRACKSTVVSGTVDMAHAGGIRPREIAENKILICCATPLQDLVIDA